MSTSQPGAVPDEFYLMPESYALALYPTPLWGLIAEASPSSGLWSSFAATAARIHVPLQWVARQFPDLRSAREMTALPQGLACEILGITPDDLAFIEEGLQLLSVPAALLLCRSLGWPLAVLFRDAAGLHYRTQLHQEHREFYG